MMAACKARLVVALTAADGANLPAASVHTSAAAARGLTVVPRAVVLAGPEKLMPDGTLVAVSETEESWVRRRRDWSHVCQLGVVVYHHTEEAASALILAVTQHLGVGFTDADNNFVRLVRPVVGWLDLAEVGKATGESRGSLLAGTTGAACGWEFLGGQYSETTCPKVPEFNTDVEVE